MPRNDPALVAALLERLALSADAPVTVKQATTSLGEALAGTFEITAATPRFLDHWAEITGADGTAGAARGRSGARRAPPSCTAITFSTSSSRFPAPGIDAERFVAGLRPLQPRLYSIASSLAAAPDEAHLTVSTVRYALHDLPRTGVASGYLAARTEADATVPVYIQSNDHFHLPDDDTPILMIGAGTGVAPYRAFMQEREARGAAGRSWLFFGERNFRSDFLYQVEWQELLKSGVLSRLDLAFSRDADAEDLCPGPAAPAGPRRLCVAGGGRAGSTSAAMPRTWRPTSMPRSSTSSPSMAASTATARTPISRRCSAIAATGSTCIEASCDGREDRSPTAAATSPSRSTSSGRTRR